MNKVQYKESNKNRNIIIVIVACLTVLIALSIMDFFLLLNSKINDIITGAQIKSSETMSSVVTSRLEQEINSLNQMAYLISDYDLTTNVLGDINEGTKGIKYSATDTTGIGYYGNSKKNVSLFAGFNHAINGKVYISDMSKPGGYANDESNVVTIWVPVYQDGVVIGTLRAVYGKDMLDDLFFNNISAEESFYLITDDGRYIASNQTESDWESLSSWIDFSNNEQLLNATNNLDNGAITYQKGGKGKKLILAYDDVSKDSMANSWLILSLPSSNFQSQIFKQASLTGGLVLVKVITLLLILFFGITHIYGRKIRKIQEQANLLIHDNDRYRDLLKGTGIIMFTWDLLQDSIEFTDAWNEHFRYAKPSFGKELFEQGLIVEDDMQKMKSFLERVLNQMGLGDVTIRMKTDLSSNEYRWFKIMTKTERNISDNSKKMVGFMMSVDFEKEETLKVKKNAEIDPLTKILNRNAAYSRIVDYLSGEGEYGKHMFIVADIDNFKYVNDEYGHLEGDNVLEEIAKKISKCFRSSDVVGRFGGDEFIIFVKNVEDIDVIKKIEQISEKVLIEDDEAKEKITVSFGYAIYPDDGKSYERLFQRADERMYLVKKPKFKKVSSKTKTETNEYDNSL